MLCIALIPYGGVLLLALVPLVPLVVGIITGGLTLDGRHPSLNEMSSIAMSDRGTFHDFCVSSLLGGHANLLCIVPILAYVQPTRDILPIPVLYLCYSNDSQYKSYSF